MSTFRTVALGAALSVGLVMTSVTLAQSTANPTPLSPADPNSPGALVIPDSAKDFKKGMRDDREKPFDQNPRDRRDGSGVDDRGTAGSTGDDRSSERPPPGKKSGEY